MNELPQLQPFDEHNQKLEANVRPADWVNPKPTGRYNLVVIGAGTAGLVTAAGAAGVGAKVALVERELMGGDCLNIGCVPSKALIAAARVAATVRRAAEFGVYADPNIRVDFAQIMQRIRRLRAAISPNDSAQRFRDLGVDVYFGTGRFMNSNSLDVDGVRLEFRRAVIATGSRAAVPEIPGLDRVDFLTNKTVFSLTELPRSLAVVGAGPIGCELAQAFGQLGSSVTLIESEHGVLPRDDRQAAEVLRRALERDGVKLLCCSRNFHVGNEQGIRLVGESHEQDFDVRVEKLLIATGRAPNVEGLELERVGVEYDQRGVLVNDRLQTTNPRIYAAGDICSRFQFTHAADFMARTVIRNALFKGRGRLSSLVIPWCTYTSPEVAHVGLSEKDAADRGIEIDTYCQELRDVDRAILEGDDEGFIKVHTKKGSDEVVGGTVVARHAGELISELTMAITNRIGLKKIAETIHPYPTQADGIRKLGDQYNRTRLTPLVKTIFEKWLDWSR